MGVSDSFLALFVIVVVLGITLWILFGRREEGVRRAGTRIPSRGRARRYKRVAAVLMVGAVVFLALAFTQFRFLREESSSGMVILTMDVSESMGRTDVVPSRLDAAVAAAQQFLDQVPPELDVGLVTFANEADLLVPPSAARQQVSDALTVLPRGEGTVIGDGLDTALVAIESERAQRGETPAAVLLLSDGRDTGSDVLPAEAAARAKEVGVPIYTVVLGQALSTEGAGANVELLQEIADATGGSAYTADTAGGLLDVYETLGTEISTELGISDSGALFVGIAAILAIAATVALLFALRADY